MGLHSVEELVRKHRHDEDTMRVRESEESGLVFVSVLGSAVFVRRRVASRRHFDQIDRNVFNFPWNKRKKKKPCKGKDQFGFD